MTTTREVRNRLQRTYLYLPTDRVADIEFGCWPQTVQRWVAEGFPAEWAAEMGDSMFHPRFNEFIGVDRAAGEEQQAWLTLPIGMRPAFAEEVLEDGGDWEIRRGRDGITAKWWKAASGKASIPMYLDFPVKAREDWEALKWRYALDGEGRVVAPDAIATARARGAEGWVVQSSSTGFYGWLRQLMGAENACTVFYDDPDLAAEMLDAHTALIIAGLRQIPDDVPIDQLNWWEDMAGKAGPLVGPDIFAEFMVPRYREVMQEAARHGCRLSHVDCDGNIHKLVPGWLQGGVNIMFPLEVAAGTDPFRLRNEFGMDVRLQGGIDKMAVARGRDATDRELERVAPLLDQGGYVPHLDHLVPPDIALDDYLYYRARKEALIGKH